MLLIESDPNSISSFIESFESTEATNNVDVVSTGDQALEYLNRSGDYTEAPRPDLVLLDLHLPGLTGTEILSELKGDLQLQQIPVLVLTASNTREDVIQSYEPHANAYLLKPDSPDELDELAQAVEDFWLKLVHLPPK
ncbi:response regulator [Natronosalvus rutilus]|uniref:Response regulator n=1 Tax=Natronosalvus rutilus TaxID=2953753 RepID=A0A9E7NF70_9EURY|nr:response regulator [Natronosalvus rutilus]UTF55895.1 response regulator [Natronosalvus rutilus]